MRQAIVTVHCCVVLLACAACSRTPPIVLNEQVEGTVKMDGVPLDSVRIEFIPTSSGNVSLPSSSAFTDDKGFFRLKCDNEKSGAVIGVHHVIVFQPRYEERRDGPQAAEPVDKEIIKPKRQNPPIPDIYALASKTPLRIEVTADKHTYEVTLSRK